MSCGKPKSNAKCADFRKQTARITRSSQAAITSCRERQDTASIARSGRQTSPADQSPRATRRRSVRAQRHDHSPSAYWSRRPCQGPTVASIPPDTTAVPARRPGRVERPSTRDDDGPGHAVGQRSVDPGGHNLLGPLRRHFSPRKWNETSHKNGQCEKRPRAPSRYAHGPHRCHSVPHAAAPAGLMFVITNTSLHVRSSA